MAVEGKWWRALTGFFGPVVSAAVLLAAVGGCSRVPDAVNPVEWYKNSKELFAGEDDKKPAATESDKEQSTLAADRGKPPPGAGKPAPNLGSFPDRPPITRAERSGRAAQGLVSGREGRRYSSESIQRQDEPVEALALRIEAAMAGKLNPENASAYYYRGIAYGDKGDYGRAIADYDTAISLDPKYTDAYNNRAWAYFKWGKAAKGLPDANKVIELDPKYAPAYDTRGHIFEALDRKDEAIADFRKALQLDPSNEKRREPLERLGVTP